MVLYRLRRKEGKGHLPIIIVIRTTAVVARIRGTYYK